MNLRRQFAEIKVTNGRILIPKLSPYFKAVKYWGKGIPLKQVSALDNLLTFTKFLQQNQITYFLTGGTLLGSVRQDAFAGRPGDIDLGIFEEDEQKLLHLVGNLKKIGFIRDEMYVSHPDKIVFTKWRSPHVDVMVYRPVSRGQSSSLMQYQHVNALGQVFVCPINLSVSRLGKIFDFQFPIPHNAEEVIENQYGSTWRTPDAPQPSLRRR